MAFSSSQREQFSERNVGFGQEGAEKRRKQLSDYANILQELKNQGQMNLQDDQQEFDLPEQTARVGALEAGTEQTQVGTEGERFYQDLAKQYGPTAMRQSLNLPEPESRANVRFPERGDATYTFGEDASLPALPGMRAKSDVSAVRMRGGTPAFIGGGGEFRGGGSSGDFRGPEDRIASNWDEFMQTPLGRGLGLPAITKQSRKASKEMDVIGRLLGKGLRRTVTPRRKREGRAVRINR